MKSENSWKPSKFALRRGKLRASRDLAEVALSSRLMVDLVATHYQTHVPRFAHGDLLDLGCGKAPLFMVYKEFAKSVTCIDWSNTLHANPYLDIEADINGPLPLPNSAFDTVILSDVFEHIRKPAHLMTEISRVLRPDGHLLMNVPFMYWLHEEPFDYYRYTRFALEDLFVMAGLKTVSITPIGGAPEVLTDVLVKNTRTVPVFGKLVTAAAQSLVFSIGQTKLGKKISLRSGARFPLGYFAVAFKPEQLSANVG